jgi:sec-independent protein translocase protein TatA
MFILPLFLNDIGGSEIVLIMLVVLMFFGSKSIPGIAKTLGRTLYEFRNATSELQNEIKKSGFDMKNELNIENIIKEKADTVLEPMDQVFSDIENTVHYGATTQNSAIKTSESVVENSENQLEKGAKSSENQIPQETVNTDITANLEEPITTKTSEK